MLIIWGSRHYFKKGRVTEVDTCQHCGQDGMLETYTARKWAHLYFIPLIPMANERVIRMCSSCNRYSSLSPDDLDQAIADTIADASEHLQQGRPDDAAGAVSTLIYLGDREQAERLVAQLQQAGHVAHAWIARALVHEKSSQPGEACEAYRQAVTLEPGNVMFRSLFAESLFRCGRFQEALTELQNVRQLAPDDPGPLALMFDCHAQLKDLPSQVEVMHEMQRLQPELETDKKFQKQLRKLAKKAGKVSGANPYAQA
jgi:predicted Zn-dependent protease